MTTSHPPKENEELKNDYVVPEKEGISDKWIIDKLDSLIPLIHERWPNIAKQTIEATKGSIDDLVGLIEKHSGASPSGIRTQLFEIIDSIQSNNWEITDKLEPIETQLEELLDELNQVLRPKIENPIRKKPILSIAIAAGIGIILGSLLNTRRN